MGGPVLPDNHSIGSTGLPSRAAAAARSIAAQLLDLGFSVDFAPVADVHIPGSGGVIGKRSYGTSAELVARMSTAFSRALEEEGILSVAKHFPGHGAAAGDSHEGKTLLNAPTEVIEERELLPFKAAVRNQVGGIMLGHITAHGPRSTAEAGQSLRQPLPENFSAAASATRV